VGSTPVVAFGSAEVLSPRLNHHTATPKPAIRTTPPTAAPAIMLTFESPPPLEPLEAPVGAIVPPEIVFSIAEPTEIMSFAVGAVTLLYVVVSDATTAATAVANEVVSATPRLATAVSTPDATETTELYCTSIAARRTSLANATHEQPVL